MMSTASTVATMERTAATMMAATTTTRDEHCNDAGIEYSNNDGDGNGNDGDHDEDDGIGDRRGQGRINNQQQ